MVNNIRIIFFYFDNVIIDFSIITLLQLKLIAFIFTHNFDIFEVISAYILTLCYQASHNVAK